MACQEIIFRIFKTPENAVNLIDKRVVKLGLHYSLLITGKNFHVRRLWAAGSYAGDLLPRLTEAS